jgi:hypothetical protein
VIPFLSNLILTPNTGHAPRSSKLAILSFWLPYLQGKGRRKEGAGGLYSRTDHVLVCVCLGWGLLYDKKALARPHLHKSPSPVECFKLVCCFLVRWPWFSGSPHPQPQPFLSLVHFDRIMRGTTIIAESLRTIGNIMAVLT